MGSPEMLMELAHQNTEALMNLYLYIEVVGSDLRKYA